MIPVENWRFGRAYMRPILASAFLAPVCLAWFCPIAVALGRGQPNRRTDQRRERNPDDQQPLHVAGTFLVIVSRYYLSVRTAPGFRSRAEERPTHGGYRGY